MVKKLKYALITLGTAIGLGALTLGGAYFKHNLSRKLEDKLEDRQSIVVRCMSTDDRVKYDSDEVKRLDNLNNWIKEIKYSQDFVNSYSFFLKDPKAELKRLDRIMIECEKRFKEVDETRLAQAKEEIKTQEFKKIEYLVELYKEEQEKRNYKAKTYKH